MKSSVYPTSVHDWMNAIRRPTPYRVGNARLHLKTRSVVYTVMFVSAAFVLILCFIPRHYDSRLHCLENMELYDTKYDYTYPLSPPLKTGDLQQYRIALIADLDTSSKSKEKKNTWFSYFHEGNFTISQSDNHIHVSFEKNPRVLKSALSQGGRGMELSELIIFNGKLFTVDDRTGIIYNIDLKTYQVYPWVVLADGNGYSSKGFKCEWASVRHNRLYVGGLGKEWTTIDGVVENTNPQFVKTIGMNGDVMHLDWHGYYNAMRDKAGFSFPGYIIHESGVWSDLHQRWFFLPRRASKEKYEEKADERRATNLMIVADSRFNNIQVKRIGPEQPTKGFSSFKFIPGTNDQAIVALKSEEDDGKIASYITAFTVEGEILLKEQKIGDVKYEGIEFI